MTATSWGGLSSDQGKGISLPVDETLLEWMYENETLFILHLEGWNAKIVTEDGSGYLLYWAGGDEEWAELYADLSTALARLAVIIRGEANAAISRHPDAEAWAREWTRLGPRLLYARPEE